MNLVERLREKRVGVYEIFNLHNETASRIEELESVLRFVYPVLIAWSVNHTSDVTNEAVEKIKEVLK